MDSERFDQLSRDLAGATTRRRLLRGLFGAVTAGTVFSPVIAEAGTKPSKCLPAGSTCKMDKQCCNGKCCNGKCCDYLCCNGKCCSYGQVCLSGDCCSNTCGPTICLPDQYTCCDPATGFYANLTSDSNNCGKCGNICPQDTTCISGYCQCNDPSKILCNGICVDPKTDNNHCGGCSPCQTTQICCNGLCIDPKTDDLNCGQCSFVCLDSHCCNGTCCGARTPTCCGGTTCVNTDIDDQNCGTCGNVCSGGTACNGYGQCACPIGQKFCGGLCVPEDWAACFRADLGNYCCPPGTQPCSDSAPSGCT